MNERFDGYFDDLNLRLAPHFDKKRRDEVIAELRSHASYGARDAQEELGLDLEEATRGALRALGPVETVAEDLVRQHRGGTAKSAWRVLRVPIALYVVHSFIVPVVDIAMKGRLTSPFSAVGMLVAWLPTLCLIAFAMAVWRSRRWLVKPMSVVIAASFLLGAFFSMTPAYRAMVSTEAQLSSQHRAVRLREIESELRMTELGGKGYLESPDKFTLGANGGLYFFPEVVESSSLVRLPFMPVAVPMGRNSVVMLRRDVWSPERAENWNRYGAEMRESLLEDRQAVLSGRGRAVVVGGLGLIAAMFGVQVGVLALVNLGILAASNRRRRRRIHRDPHLA